MRPLNRLLLLTVASGLAMAGDISLPLFFIENPGPNFGRSQALKQGMTDARFRYLAQTPGMAVGFSRDSIAFQLPTSQIQLHFPGANPETELTAGSPLNAHANFIRGTNSDQWHTSLPLFAEICYRNLYPGVDLIYGAAHAGPSGHAGRNQRAGQSENFLKSEFRVAAGADPARIVLSYSHAVELDADGDLIVGDAGGKLREKSPDVYQETENGRVKVAARYRLLGAHTATFELESYNHEKPLIIDPVISYATYLGGSNEGAVTGTAVDSSGNLYVTGWTMAVNFPTLAPAQSANGGSVDAFVVKLNSTGNTLIYATYLGGKGIDQAAGIAVDSAGEAYITGSTASTNFPLVSPIISKLLGTKTAFVSKLNSAGNALLFSTYLGGTAYDMGTAITLDSSGDAWVVGDTQSANFPLIFPLQFQFGGATDIFVARFSSAGVITFSTLWGGTAAEHAGGVSVDSSGYIYVAGGTYSTNLPVVAAVQPANAGNQDAFVLKFYASTSSSFVVYATYLGGSGTVTGEQANGIAADANGNAYVTGVTNSANFPVTAGTVQTTYGGDQDAFVTKINSSGSALVYSTYLGGSSFDWANGIGLDSAGNAHIAGYTSSFDFPNTSTIQPTLSGLYNSFVTVLNTTAGVLAFSTYYGGTGSDTANAIAVDSSGNMYIGGQTSSINLPLTAPLESANTGGITGWVARLGVTAAPPQTPSAVSVTPSSGSGATSVFTAVYSDSGGGSALTTAGFLVNLSGSTSEACWVTYSPSSNLFSLANDIPSSGSSTTLPGGTSVQNDQCVLNGTASSVTISGNTLTLTISLYFQPGFAGPQTLFLSATDATSSTGFVALGTWTATIPAPAPTVVSVTPNAGTGAGQTFIFTFSDPSSANNLAAVALLFSTSSTALTNSCWIVVDRNAGSIALLWDTGLGSNSKAIGAATVLQNDQCSVGANSLTLTGQTLSLTIAIGFTATFNGPKNIYMDAAEVGISTGFIQEGTFTVIAAGVSATSVVPSSGSGTGQRFSFTISDPRGSSFLVAMAMLFSSSTNVNNACSLVWDSTAGTISLAYDTQANGATPVVPGTNTTASNAQCTINAANSTVQINPTSVVVTVDLTFTAVWAGVKNIYLYGAEAYTNTGYVIVGAWTVTSGAPTAVSVAPASGAGHFPSFVFTGSDSSSAANITSAGMLFTVGSPANTASACYVVINRTTSQISLYSDAGTSFTSKAVGSATGLQNSQCAVGYSSVSTAGTSVVFTVQIEFTTATFAGAKTVYLEVNEPTTSTGWVAVGTWTAQ